MEMQCYIRDYPRPQFVRKNWELLNGEWDFAFDDNNIGEKEGWFKLFPEAQKIEVPFTYETKASGIADESIHENIWYSKKIYIGEKCSEENLILHFEGSDYRTKVWINGIHIGVHEGGHTRFSLDISQHVIKGINNIVVKVEDSLDPQQPRGKQRWLENSFGCWYVQTTGIWKSVWMERVPVISIKGVKMTPVVERGKLELEYDILNTSNDNTTDIDVEATISFKGRKVAKSRVMVDKNVIRDTIDLRGVNYTGTEWGIEVWTTKTPNLYDIEFHLYVNEKLEDVVESYFGMREIRIDGPNILLNGCPIYQKLILDQGYWEESHLTPPNEEALIVDLDKIVELGYNGIRKHQKIEDERFLYWCDVKGILVWSEAPSNYVYSDRSVTMFIKEWMEMVKQNYNHPCIITWVPLNESWGFKNVETDRMQQHFSEAVYHLTKSIDKYRPVVVNDGWEHTVSDIITLHDYEESGDEFFERYTKFRNEILDTSVYHCRGKSAFANGYQYNGQPIMISEFGGIAFSGDESGWGYGNKVESEEEFIDRFDKITSTIKKIPYICGYCYTQVTDVQQETNGLLDIHRKAKIDPEIIRKINEKMK